MNILVKLEVHATSRRLVKQIEVLQHLTEVEFRMVKWIGWISADAIERGSPEYLIGTIGTRYILFPSIRMLEPMLTHTKGSVPHVYIP
jgi:hypothetical protein